MIFIKITYLLLIIITIIGVALLFYFFSNHATVSNDPKTNLKIINAHLIGNYDETVKDLKNKFGDIFIINGLYNSGNNSEKHVYGDMKSAILEYPYISENTLEHKKIFIPNFKSSVSYSLDFILLNDLLVTPFNTEIHWYIKDNNFLNRTKENTFFETTLEDNKTHYSRIIITRYIYNNQAAVHINHIVKKMDFHSQISIDSFIGFLNFVKNFLDKNKIFYFSLGGISNIRNSYWTKFTKFIFKDTVYISPGTADKFITQNNYYKNIMTTSDFIIISKSMAPHGVYFYTTKNTETSNLLVAEILCEENKSKYKSIHDETEKIYRETQKRKEEYPNIEIDKVLEYNVDLTVFNLKLINDYHSINNTKTIQHISSFKENSRENINSRHYKENSKNKNKKNKNKK